MLIYTYLNIDECLLTFSMQQQRFKLKISINYAIISERLLVALNAVEVIWFPITHLLAKLMIVSIHAWLDKDQVTRHVKKVSGSIHNTFSGWFYFTFLGWEVCSTLSGLFHLHMWVWEVGTTLSGLFHLHMWGWEVGTALSGLFHLHMWSWEVGTTLSGLFHLLMWGWNFHFNTILKCETTRT